jgi:hypothetical protein
MNLRTDKHKDNHMHSRDKRNPQHVNGSDSTFCGSSFVVGQHVVCVNDNFCPRPGARQKWERLGVRFPKKSTIYTIRRVFISPKGATALLLDEIKNPLVPASGVYIEAYFLASRFRPLQKLKLEDFMPIVEHLTDEVRA